MAKNRQETKVSSRELQEKVAKIAYGLYHKRGCRQGNDWQDWFEAERLVKSGKA